MTGAVGDLTPARIAATERLIRPYIRRTPVLEVSGRDVGVAGATLAFKLELCQHAGSFKTRGAFANLLSRPVPAAGVVAASGGNHGVAVAFAARQLSVPARIFVPAVASQEKIDKIRGHGAELVITGERYADALVESERWAAQTGALRIHAYDQLETLLGQGTLALEFEQQTATLDTLLVAVGGGGLIGGIAAWFSESTGTPVRIIGVEPERAPTLTRALAAGEPVDSPAGGIAADSLAPRQVGRLMFPLAQRRINDVLLVSDQSIEQAQALLWTALRIVTEPGGAAAFAALASRAYVPRAGERVGIVLCGGNTTAVDFARTPARSAPAADGPPR